MTEKRSRHAAKLRELGFVPNTPEVQAYILRRTELRMAQMGTPLHSLPRSKRRLVLQELNKPYFIVVEGEPATIILNDETGWKWKREGMMDIEILKRMGFPDSTAATKKLHASMPPLKMKHDA